MTKNDLNRGFDRDPNIEDPADNSAGGPANDNDGATAPASKGSALASTSLAALTATFRNVDITSIGGRPAKPLLQYKSREGGIWAFGTRRTIPESGSLWAANPASFLWGWVCWGDAKKTVGEKLVPVSQPMPDVTELPDKGFPWQQEMSVDLTCISGTDAGVEVVFKSNTEGGKGELTLLIKAVQDRINGGQHGGKVVPIVQLETDSYGHEQFGKTHIPVMAIADWMPLNGPAPAPTPTPTPAGEQPRRRRVG